MIENMEGSVEAVSREQWIMMASFLGIKPIYYLNLVRQSFSNSLIELKRSLSSSQYMERYGEWEFNQIWEVLVPQMQRLIITLYRMKYNNIRRIFIDVKYYRWMRELLKYPDTRKLNKTFGIRSKYVIGNPYKDDDFEIYLK